MPIVSTTLKIVAMLSKNISIKVNVIGILDELFHVAICKWIKMGNWNLIKKLLFKIKMKLFSYILHIT